MLSQFLHEQLEIAFNFGIPKPEMPESITQNLNPEFKLRSYQEDAFASFIHYYNNDLPGKEKPLHLLFNMATGSGKTLIIAGLILYLYEKGYRNFLFFVNSTNIIEKTKDNFRTQVRQADQNSRDVQMADIEQNIVRAAIARNPFFSFASLRQYFPHLTSVREFITSKNYLGGLAITFKGNLAILIIFRLITRL